MLNMRDNFEETILLNSIYYTFKPAIPRRLQIFLRRYRIRQIHRKYSHVWPIDEKAAKLPEGWSGWPGGKRFALVLTHDVDTEGGWKRCKQLAEIELKIGFRSSFNFVPKRYLVSKELIEFLVKNNFEVGVHGLQHDGKLYKSKKIFQKRAIEINEYLEEWNAVGFRSPSMQHNLEWIHSLNIEYDSSTFDTDPFEPQPDGVETIFPFWVPYAASGRGYVELPYTLAQDHTLFVLMKEKGISIWKKKVDWIAEAGGMALVNVHPDYINFSAKNPLDGQYPIEFYLEFLEYVKNKYEFEYWHALPKEITAFFRSYFKRENKK